MEQKERTDAWGADLPEKVRWDIYDLARSQPWPQAVAAQLQALGVVRLPSRAGWYRFLNRMRRADSQRRIEKIAESVAEAQSVADKAGIKSKTFIETMKTLAIDCAISGDNKSATALAAAAASIWDRAQRDKELELKDRAQETKDAALALAREKFEAAEKRLNAVKNAVGTEDITDAERVAKVRSIFGLK